MRHAIVGLLVSCAALCGCGDGDTVTGPPPPMDVSGAWHGGLTSSQLAPPCATPEPTPVTVTFTQTGTQVTGTFHGACLDGATFEGRATDQRLIGGTTVAGRFCPESATTSGRGSTSRLQLEIDVHVATQFTGCTGPLRALGTLRLDLSH
jgi:hypothetical protein